MLDVSGHQAPAGAAVERRELTYIQAVTGAQCSALETYLLRSAIGCDDPAIVLESRTLHPARAPIRWLSPLEKIAQAARSLTER